VRFRFEGETEDVPVAIEEHIVRSDRIEQVGNGIAMGRFDPARFTAQDRAQIRAELGLEPHHVAIGMVGRLVAEKGYLEAFAAAKQLATRVPDARFLFIGGLEDKPDAIGANALVEHGIAGTAQMLGHRKDVERLYAAMDIFMLPSHREGFPRSVMEAAAMAKHDGVRIAVCPAERPQRKGVVEKSIQYAAQSWWALGAGVHAGAGAG